MRYKVEVGDVIGGMYCGYDFTGGAEVLSVSPDGTAQTIKHEDGGVWWVRGLNYYTVISRGSGKPGVEVGSTVRAFKGPYEGAVGKVIRDWSLGKWSVDEKVRKTMEKFKLLLTKEPFKTYRKAGITNGDNILTDDGVKIFLTYLLEKNPEFIEVAKELVDEKK